jgi:adenosylmethionine-8-amino-7-oxononanoate aminotransferase
MSVCDPVTGMHALFSEVLPQHLFAERPTCAYGDTFDESHIEEFSAMLRENRDEVAAVILEPIVQGAGGMWFYAPEYLRRVRALCDEHDVLLILDEIATGFGRTGELFGCDHAGVAPDIMCVGKALTGGTLSLAATLVTDRVCEAVSRGEPGALLHGPTFMGNPLACAAARASLALLATGAWRDQVKGIEAQLRGELESCRSLPQVSGVRVLGAIGVVELHEPVDMAIVQPAFVAHGVWLRPFGRLVYTMPPYVIAAEDLSRITAAIRTVIVEHCAPKG